jgi:hypothetical protein
MSFQEKLSFLLNDFPTLLQQLNPEAKGNWGLMNAQQMVEHMVISVKNANGKLKLPQLNQGETLEKFRSFLFSEKPFRENTKNPLIGDPSPLHFPDMQTAINKLRSELQHLVDVFQDNPALTTLNPIFGPLDFEGNVQLLHKHAVHHLRQFGLS